MSVNEFLASLLFVVDVGCCFFVGEMIGRRNINGYQRHPSFALNTRFSFGGREEQVTIAEDIERWKNEIPILEAALKKFYDDVDKHLKDGTRIYIPRFLHKTAYNADRTALLKKYWPMECQGLEQIPQHQANCHEYWDLIINGIDKARATALELDLPNGKPKYGRISDLPMEVQIEKYGVVPTPTEEPKEEPEVHPIYPLIQFVHTHILPTFLQQYFFSVEEAEAEAKKEA